MKRLFVIALLIAVAATAEEAKPAAEAETVGEAKPEGNPESESVDANIESDESSYDDMAPDEMIGEGEDDFDYDHEYDYDDLDSVEYDNPEEGAADAAAATGEKPAAEEKPAATNPETK